MDHVALRAWGNSQGIRIPKSIMNELDLKVSDVLDIEIVDDAIVLRNNLYINLLKTG